VEPTFANLEARMRDGTLLRADVYTPPAAPRAPVLLVRTPYGKDGWRERPFVAKALARGFALIVQDVRGRYASDGVFDPYRQEGRDGYDTIEWAARQPWCTGRVGMCGLSYPGAVQWLAAVEAPPALACIFPAMCFSSGRQFFYFGGAFDLSWIPWIALNIAPEERRRRGVAGPTTAREAREQWLRHGRDWLRHVPLITLPVFRDIAPFYYEWLDHPDAGSFWAFADIEGRHDRVAVPSFNLSGWYDEGYGPVGAVRNFLGMRARGATASARAPRLLIGPWTHGEPTLASTRVGDRDFGPAAGLDYDALVLDWGDWHLRGVDRGLASAPPVRIFVLGANRWREGADWPPVPVTARELFLRAGRRLSWTPPAPAEPPDTYRSDPNDPVEDPYYAQGLGPHDQRAIAGRPDVLTFTTDPLEMDLEVIGPIEFRIWIASTAPDTDLFARLLDIEPDGTMWNLMSPTLEVLRLRYRRSEHEPELLVPGVPYEVRLPSGPTAALFRRGHRIGVQITSSFFPHLDRNPNTGRPVPVEDRLVPATQTLYHDARRPSRVILPLVQT
jgi:putative CocE/NonD family hydrolase